MLTKERTCRRLTFLQPLLWNNVNVEGFRIWEGILLFQEVTWLLFIILKVDNKLGSSPSESQLNSCTHPKYLAIVFLIWILLLDCGLLSLVDFIPMWDFISNLEKVPYISSCPEYPWLCLTCYRGFGILIYPPCRREHPCLLTLDPENLAPLSFGSITAHLDKNSAYIHTPHSLVNVSSTEIQKLQKDLCYYLLLID